MPDNVSISINGQSQVPPGFRFHPTEEELLQYYLRKKSRSETIDLDVIKEIDLNKLEPWDIKEKCRIGGSTLQNDWYFFSHKDKKYPTGSRTNRATIAGFWKATGRDKIIYSSAAARIGMRKTLVFYTGRAPLGLKSDWIMHEYRLGDDDNNEEGWVVCKIFRKRQSRKKSQDEGTTVVTSNVIDCSQIRMDNPDTPREMYDDQISGVGQDDGTLEQIFQHIRPKQSAANIAISEEEEDNAHVPNTTNILAGKLVTTCPDDIVYSQYNDNECWTTVEQLSFHHHPPSLENQINANMHMNSHLGFHPNNVYQVDTGLNDSGCPMQNLIYNSGDGGILSDSTTVDHHQLMITQLSSAHDQPLEAAAFNTATDLELYDSIIPSYYDYYI